MRHVMARYEGLVPGLSAAYGYTTTKVFFFRERLCTMLNVSVHYAPTILPSVPWPPTASLPSIQSIQSAITLSLWLSHNPSTRQFTQPLSTPTVTAPPSQRGRARGLQRQTGLAPSIRRDLSQWEGSTLEEGDRQPRRTINGLSTIGGTSKGAGGRWVGAVAR